MTMAEKILARHVVGGDASTSLKPGDPVVVRVDGGYSHEFTTAQVHFFLENEYGADYQVKNPAKFAVFEDHLIYADGVPRMAPFSDKIERLRRLQSHQEEITAARSGERIGRTVAVLVDQVEDGVPVGRSFREAPEIDGVIVLDRGEPGEWVTARVTGSYGADTTAEVVA